MYLQSLFVIFNVVAIDVMMRANRLAQLWSHHHSVSFRCWPSSEEHDPSSGVLKGRLQQAHRHSKSDTCAPQGALIIRHGPGISLQLLQCTSQLELTLLNGQQKSSGGSHGRHRPARLGWHVGPQSRCEQPKHFLHLLCRIVLVASKHVGFGALRVTKFMNLDLRWRSTQWLEKTT